MVSITTYPPAPGRCVKCYRESDGRTEFVDTGASEEYYGAIYFCVPCCVEIGQSVGLVTQGDVINANVSKETHRLENIELTEKVQAYERLFMAYGSASFDLSDMPGVPSVAAFQTLFDAADDELNSSGDNGESSSLGEGSQSGTAKPATV